MINTDMYDEMLDQTMTSNLSVLELKQRYADVATEASSLFAYTQALEESMMKYLSEEEIEKIANETQAMLDDYFFRYTSPEERDLLKEYGYTHPVVPIGPEDVRFCLDESIPILLLYSDDTERIAKDGMDIKNHTDKNGMVGISQYSYEKMELIRSFGKEER